MKIKIYITKELNPELKDLGIETESSEELRWLYFNPNHLSAFWIPPDEGTIRFYIGGLDFMCVHTKENKELLSRIIDET